MTIAVDIDGVLTDIETFMKEEGKKYFNKEIVNHYGDDVRTIFNVSRDTAEKFWCESFLDYAKKYPARNMCGEVLTQLHNEGNKIYIVTARDCSYGFEGEQHLRSVTEAFLLKNGIKYDALYFYPSPKLKAVKDLDIDIFIEDSPYNITNLANLTKVIAFNTSYNKHVNSPSISRAFTWNEVYDIIKNLEI